jgi:pyrroloquinoline quinone biosynthesis protein B
MKKNAFLIGLGLFFCPMTVFPQAQPHVSTKLMVVLGVAQDAGYPQAGCSKPCCKQYWDGKESRRNATCLGIVDLATKQYWLIEATPDLRGQLQDIGDILGHEAYSSPEGILLTHAHIGHYTGLIQLGREVMGAQKIPVYAMPRMAEFLTNNGPWSQLVSAGNIVLRGLQADSVVKLADGLSIQPVLVPHRDEYSETVGYRIIGNNKTILFIPDIDKWEKWEKDLVAELKEVDQALIDGTFYDDKELPGRDMSEIPHPFIIETTELLGALDSLERSKVKFIHFNHTNPILRETEQKEKLLEKGFKVAEEGEIINL